MARRKWNLEIIEQVLDGQNPFFQSGYTAETVPKRKDGEEWTDSKGNSWKQLDGAKIKVNKQMDSIRGMLKRICSKCGQNIDFSNDKLDNKVFPKTGKCYTCLEAEEMILRMTGKYEMYEELKLLKNKRGLLKEFKYKVEEAIEFLNKDTGKMEMVMSNGNVETWNGKSNPQWLNDAKSDLIKVTETLELVEQDIKKLEEKI